ncbi:MAG TPA: hypothetical protein VNK03_03990 [Gammaproteobacteria bacterium]|nr:hypothetical protein [Gammaproteobacteria bacterium]
MKKTYQFTLILKYVDENALELEDALYKAGCNDALISFRNRTVSLDFNREVETFKEAVISSIRDVESSSLYR